MQIMKDAPSMPEPADDMASLRSHALRHYAARCFWNVNVPEGPAGTPMIVERLKKNGDMSAWRLALRIEALSDAA